jgi:hypothetical protein
MTTNTYVILRLFNDAGSNLGFLSSMVGWVVTDELEWTRKEALVA